MRKAEGKESRRSEKNPADGRTWATTERFSGETRLAHRKEGRRSVSQSVNLPASQPVSQSVVSSELLSHTLPL